MANSLTMNREAISLINQLANEPRNLAMMGLEWVDLSPFFDRPGNVALGDASGVALFCETEPGVYVGHYLFSSNLSGKQKLAHAKRIIDALFTQHGAKAILGETPKSNLAARQFTRALGFTPQGTTADHLGRSCVVYRMERSKWVASLED